LTWIPDEAKNSKRKQTRIEDLEVEKPGRNNRAVKEETLKKVVEYLVLQKRVLNGVEDSTWKIWGFAEESTPNRLKGDAEYWRRTLDAHAA
jgi:protein MBA1